MSKILAENFKDKSLKVYGLDLPKIKGILPTNLPEIHVVNEMKLEQAFLSRLEQEKIIINMYKLGDKLDRIAKVTDTDIDLVKKVIAEKQ